MNTFLFTILHLAFFIALLGVTYHEENSRDADAQLADVLNRWCNLPPAQAERVGTTSGEGV